MAERFWGNLSIILAERNISWIELTRKMLRESFTIQVIESICIKRYATTRLEQRMPQSPWVERIVQVLDLDYEDLFRR